MGLAKATWIWGGEMTEILLSWTEVALAAQVGLKRQLNAIKDGRKDQHGFKGDGWETHIVGACGELAAAKAIGVYWTPTVDTFKSGGDIGKLQVRTRSLSWHELYIRPDDRVSDVFILVTGAIPSFTVRGWYPATQARRDEWWKDHGNRDFAWFVPQRELNPLKTIDRDLQFPEICGREAA